MKTMNANPCTPVAQATRRTELFAEHRRILSRIFSPNGVYLGHDDDSQATAPHYTLIRDATNSAGVRQPIQLDPRIALWHAFAAFDGDEQDIRLANGILRHTSFLPGYDFGMAALLQLHRRYAHLYENDVAEKASSAIAATGNEQAESPGFVGMNDNFAAMAVSVLIHAGELTSRPELVARGIEFLRDLVSRLDTYGAIAEFNSPTYTPLTQCCMADIIQFSVNEEARQLALRIESQTWYDLCARFHPQSGNMAGPSSRAYTADSCGHMHNARWLWQIAFGEEHCPLSPRRFSYGKAGHLVLHHNDPTFIPANGCWIAASTYHVPEDCVAMMLKRPSAITTVGTAAPATLWYPDDWRYQAQGRESQRFRKFITYKYGTSLLTTHMTEDFALSTSSGALACGRGSQQDAFFATWRRRIPSDAKPLDMQDVRTAYVRYVFNNAQPATINDALNEDGWPTCVQHNGAALVLYRPGTERTQDITSMRTAVIMPMHAGAPEEVWIGETQMPGLEGESEEPQTVFIRDGRMALAFRPLSLTNYGRPTAVRVSVVEKFLTLNFYNYEGPARSLNFPQMAALFTANGFAVEMEMIPDDAAFDAFRQRINGAILTDVFTNGTREVRYERKGLSLRITNNPSDTSAVPAASINEKPREVTRFCTTGVSGLPF